MDNISIMCRNLCYVASEHESYLKYRYFCICYYLMVVNMYKHMGKVVIKILQGSAVTQTTLGGLTIRPRVVNFLQCICAKNYGNWLAVDKVIAKIIRLTFLAHPVYHRHDAT